MKKIVKNSIEWTIITIALCILVVVLAAAIKDVATNSNHHSFFQMVSDSLPKDNSLIRKGTPSQSIVSSSLGILTIFLFFAGIFSNHILFKKYGWSLEKLSWLTILIGIILSVLLMNVFIFMTLSSNILIKLLFSVLTGGNLYLLFRLILDYSYTFIKFSFKKRNHFPAGITTSNKKM
ncbi:hypothetical protein O3631_05305 [Streptococcus salivarius]|jgi:hypothetical protein|uniref:hypothetical protein n=1 Tax=Streptococcus salivarius TaxID=1304 RepID=UPI0018AC6739|nr:hypothetical protein [Streptococcus salivarius]